MLTKRQYIDILCSMQKDKKSRYLCDENGLARIIEGTFLTKEEQNEVINATRSLYGSSSFNKEYVDSFVWDEEHWIALLNHLMICELTDEQTGYNTMSTIIGVVFLLELDFNGSIKHIKREKYARFYNDNDPYGYYNIPTLIDIANHFDFEIDQYLDKITGFVPESEVPAFDMLEWQQYFKKSKMITTLSKAVTNGEMLNESDLPKYNWGGFDHYAIRDKFYPYAENMWMIHQVVGQFIPLRKVDIGSGYVEELINKFGWLVGFYGEVKTPIYKIKTKQGYNFYICGSDWHGGVYIDDISIKKIKFGNPKPVNKELDEEKRIFIIYNGYSGYWRTPELYYPKKFKQFMLDYLNKHKKEIGNSNSTHVFASSRTLNSFNYDGENIYPDVRSKEEFLEVVVKNAANKALENLHLTSNLKDLGLKISVSYDNGFDFDTVVKPLPLTQEEIDKYVTVGEVTYEVEKYK